MKYAVSSTLPNKTAPLLHNVPRRYEILAIFVCEPTSVHFVTPSWDLLKSHILQALEAEIRIWKLVSLLTWAAETHREKSSNWI